MIKSNKRNKSIQEFSTQILIITLKCKNYFKKSTTSDIIVEKEKRKKDMNKFYVITGPSGGGKSTISKEIAKASPKSALIEGDEIYHLVCGGHVSAWKEGNHLKVFWENSIDIIENFLENGYDVVFNYIINKEKLDELKTRFKNVEIKFIVLMVDEETLVERDKLRPEDCQMKERSLILLENMKKQGFCDDNILETSKLSIKETVETILNSNQFII